MGERPLPPDVLESIQPPVDTRDDTSARISQLERRLLFADHPTNEEINEDIAALDALAPEVGAFYEGAEAHALGQAEYQVFLRNVGRSRGSAVVDMSRREMQQEWQKSEEHNACRQAMSEAIDQYHAVHRAHQWRSERLKPYEPAMLGQDLSYEHARLFDVSEERDAVLAEKEGELFRTASDIEDAGVRGEYQCIAALRKVIRLRGLDHVVSLSHTTPRDDKKNGRDLVLHVGAHTYYIDLKVLKWDGYVDEYNEEYLDRSKQKADVATSVISLDHAYFRDAMKSIMAFDPDNRGEDRLPPQGVGILTCLKGGLQTKNPDVKKVIDQLKGRKKGYVETEADMFERFVVRGVIDLFAEALEARYPGKVEQSRSDFTALREIKNAVKQALAEAADDGVISKSFISKNLESALKKNTDLVASIARYM